MALALSGQERLLHECARSRARRFMESEAALVEAVREVDRVRLFEKLRVRSTFAYCVEILKLSEDVASNVCRVARKSEEVPALLAAIARGEMTVSKARQIVTVLTPGNQTEWLEKARTLSKSDLEREVAKVNPRALARERVKALAEDLYQLEVGISHDLSEKLRRAQELCCQNEKQFASLERTLEVMADFFLGAKDPVERAKRAKGRKRRSAASPVSRAPRSPRRQSIIRRKPIPAEVRHAVHARDGGCCQAVGRDGGKCLEKKWVDLHHVIPVAEGGEDVAANLTTLCAFHHRLEHRRSSRRWDPRSRSSRDGGEGPAAGAGAGGAHDSR